MNPTAGYFYYRNRTGLVAVSYDEGDTLILPTGKVVESWTMAEGAWEETPEDLFSVLSDKQREALEILVAAQDDSEMGEIVANYTKARKAMARQPNAPPREVVYRRLGEAHLVVKSDFDD
jgi:hypothetical protein